MELLYNVRPQRHAQLAHGLRLRDLARADPGEVTVHDIGPYLALEDGVTPVAHVLEQQQSQHHFRGRTLAPAREAMCPAARQHLVDQLHELPIGKHLVDLAVEHKNALVFPAYARPFPATMRRPGKSSAASSGRSSA